MDIVSYLLGKNSAGGGGGGKYKPQIIKFTNFAGTDLLYETENLDTSLITDMSNMFNNCPRLNLIDISSWDLSNVTTFQSMFYGCTGFAKMKFPAVVFTHNVSFSSTFNNLYNATEIDISEVTLNNSTIDMSSCFYLCRKAEKIDMRGIDTSLISAYSNMFGVGQTSGPANNCLIIVGTDTDKTWVQTNFSRLTNVKTVAEYEG